MHDTQGAPVRIGRVIVRPDGTREELDPLVDAAHDDMAGGVLRGPYGEPIYLNPTTDDPDDDPYADLNDGRYADGDEGG